MAKLIAALSVVGVMMVGAPHAAMAGFGFGEERHEQGDGRHEQAPEPITVIGLALGAGAVGVARWASKRKPR